MDSIAYQSTHAYIYVLYKYIHTHTKTEKRDGHTRIKLNLVLGVSVFPTRSIFFTRHGKKNKNPAFSISHSQRKK